MAAPGFDWDRGNRDKCRKHSVSIAEIESVFDGAVTIVPDEHHSFGELRLRAIGRATSGRHVFVVFTLRSRGGNELIRPLSARYMHRKEIVTYEKANPDLEKDSDLPDR
jgi:uncharacterized DUF497 family protein